MSKSGAVFLKPVPRSEMREIKQEPHYTYADYLTWPDDERWELIDGVAYSMSPAPGVPHQRLVINLGRQLDVWFEGKSCEAFVSPLNVLLLEVGQAGEQADTVVQPDVIVVCDPA